MKRLAYSTWLVAGLVGTMLGVSGPASADTQRVSLGIGGRQLTGISGHATLGTGAAFLTFSSTARNVVDGDTNAAEDVFYRNLATGAVERVSVGPGNVQGNQRSLKPIPSADGAIVVFQSSASNLVTGDTNGKLDIFIRDRNADVTRRVSVTSAKGQGNGDSSYASMTPDGRYVVFQSDATNLAGTDTNLSTDVFRHDRQTGQTVRVSIGRNGAQANGNSWYPAISADGRYVAFQSMAGNLVAGDTNGQMDAFVRDMQAGVTTRVSVSATGTQGNRYSGYVDISDDGRWVSFLSSASTLVTPDTNGAFDVFLHDRTAGGITRLTRGLGGTQANGGSVSPEMSGDGRYITFGSEASNLVLGDSNGVADVFLAELPGGTIRRVSVGSNNEQGTLYSYQQNIALTSPLVLFSTSSPNLVPGDTNNQQDVFLAQ